MPVNGIYGVFNFTQFVQMINNRVAFMSAMALAVLSLFLVGGSEASLNSGDYEPSDSTRLDPSAGISFSVVLNANGDNDEGITSIVAISEILMVVGSPKSI